MSANVSFRRAAPNTSTSFSPCRRLSGTRGLLRGEFLRFKARDSRVVAHVAEASELDVDFDKSEGYSSRFQFSTRHRYPSTLQRNANLNSTFGQILNAEPKSTIGQISNAEPKSTIGRMLKYKRVMLKVSGEALQGQQGFGVDPEVLEAICAEIAEAHFAGVQIAVVVGGGNYFRGATAWKGLERATADYVGMLATVMNALCLQAALEAKGVDTRVQTAIEMREVAEPYIRRRAIRHLDENRVVVFGAGTGNPFFTTDTAAALRAAEVNAQVMLKATKVDGIYDCDPLKYPHAKKYNHLSYRQVELDNLQVMDQTAVTLCKENDIPVIVFNIMEGGNILRAALGEDVGTVVRGFEQMGMQRAGYTVDQSVDSLDSLPLPAHRM